MQEVTKPANSIKLIQEEFNEINRLLDSKLKQLELKYPGALNLSEDKMGYTNMKVFNHKERGYIIGLSVDFSKIAELGK